MNTCKITTLALIAPAMVAAAAHAEYDRFQSLSGNIVCGMGPIVNGPNNVVCEIADHAWVAPPRSPDCPLNWGSRFSLNQGGAGVFACYHQPMGQPWETLDYGQTRSVGTITCDSEPAGMTCTDGSTGHFFRVSRESYELG